MRSNKITGAKEEGDLLLLKTLRKLGITGRAATIYIFLLKKGPQKANMMRKLMRLNKAIVYRILKYLRANGFVVSTMTFPASFAAVPLNVVIDNAAKSKRREAKFLEKDKKLLCDIIKLFEVEEPSVGDDEIAILRSRNFANAKGEQLIKQTEKEALVITDGIIKPDHDMVEGLRMIIATAKRKKGRFRFLTRVDYTSLDSAKTMVGKLDRARKYNKYVKIRHIDLSPALFYTM